MAPLVSVVCLCYNHQQFVSEAVESVLNQTYPNIQIILIDDASTDNSRSIINDIVSKHPFIEVIFPEKNLGNCAAFNLALPKMKGKYVVDFATDDVMLPERIEHQVRYFETLDHSYGVVFSDAMYIDEKGEFLRNHFDHLIKHGLIKAVPQGNIYSKLVSTYFIPSPTMLVRASVMKELGGYDESLVYEDFDFWIRSSRKFKYGFQNERLTKIRKSSKSMSTGWYEPGNAQLHSTYLVCRKIHALNTSDDETEALARRLKYEIRQSVFSDNQKEAKLFFDLLKEIGKDGIIDRGMMALSKLPFTLSPVRALYHRFRYG